MDWDEEYELIKSGRAVPQAGPSFAARDDDEDNIFNDDNGRASNARQQRTPAPAPAQPDREPDFYPEEAEQNTPLEQLTRHWLNERHAPDILPAQEDLLMNLLDHLRRQSEAVQLLREDPSTSEEEHMRIMLVQTEVERVKFIVRSYVRTRLFKIERYARFIVTNADIQTRLTAAERDHASRHAKLTDQHFYVSVLQGLPEKQSHLDDTPLFVPPMITEPDKSRPVFVHARQRCPRIRLPDGATLDMEKGHISLMPYAIVEELVARGDVELI
ncbi:DNA replication complex GINS protein sld5 [Psilocybe cubensis]|uniref:DNA replication complex GINS protein SLD5 n=2 Tax=Psilocybe cubensis TaxID=181762 RepID=A0A8H8CG54_PSICU|nr:DNA replication complex GINS protein sld5 [Psilocybe cubensis]KAH9475171.1 DNA replication complex GINS protein sld5 [Psilocybe cubensis]